MRYSLNLRIPNINFSQAKLYFALFKVMTQTFIVLGVLITLIACNNPETSKLKSRQVEKRPASTTKNKFNRKVLIEKLKGLHQIVASKNKEEIAGIFEFPLSDTSFSIYIDDTTYYGKFIANGNRITKAMFLQYFKDISISIWLDQISNLFQNINVDNLLHKDTLTHEAYIKNAPCFYSYKIVVDNNTVTLRMDMNSNQKYKSKKSSEGDIPENSSEICEHDFWWIFRFDGKNLHLESISGAD